MLLLSTVPTRPINIDMQTAIALKFQQGILEYCTQDM